jgi:hypothetical protein
MSTKKKKRFAHLAIKKLNESNKYKRRYIEKEILLPIRPDIIINIIIYLLDLNNDLYNMEIIPRVKVVATEVTK